MTRGQQSGRRPVVKPLDPDSAKGREVAARLSVIFADVRASIAARKARDLFDD